MATKQLRGGIVASVKRTDAYISALGEADIPFMRRDTIISQRDLVLSLKAQFISIQDQIISSATDQRVKESEEITKDTFVADVDELLNRIGAILAHFPPEAPQLPNTGDFCTIMRELMHQNREQMKELFKSFSPTPNANKVFPVKSSNKLPEIKLPTFNGDFAEWISFRDKFRSSISNHPNLSNAQKLDYLNSALSGDAASTIKNLPVTDDNFEVAWEMLVDRFEKKNKILAAHIRNFFNMPSVSPNDLKAINKIYNILSESTLALDAIKVTSRDPWLIQFILDKLDSESRVLWGRECGDEVPTLDKFRKFLNQRCEDASNASTPQFKSTSNNRPQYSKTSQSSSKKQVNAFHNSTTAQECKCCNEGSHPKYRCSRFLAQSPSERYEYVKKFNLCRNCLASHHTTSCTFHNCKKCQARHNVLLHERFVGEAPANPTAPSPRPSNTSPANNSRPVSDTPTNPTPGPSSVSLSATTLPADRIPSACPKVFLATAQMDILTVDHQRIPCRVMLDSGAQVCIMTTRLYQKLRLPKSRSDISILGVGSQANPVKHKVTATIFSQKNGQSFTFDCYVLPKISGNIPNWAIDSSVIQLPPDVDLADPQWNVQRPVDLLICGDAYWGSLLSERINLGVGLPHLQQTIFGYVVVGEHRPPPSVHHVLHVEAVPALDEALRRFWEIEDLPGDPSVTEQQLEAEAHFASTYKRNSEGRFVVKLPFREGPELLGHSRPQAISQLLALERQFEKKPQLKALYSDVMKDYMERGWLELVPPEEFKSPAYYMPHHGVLKESSTTTKLRVVYNASAKTSSGHSLNDLLLIGPSVQPDIAIILLQFRLAPFAMTADISKMYLQVLLDPSDSNFQRLVYRDSPQEPLRDYRIPRVCFGVASSPFLATRALFQLAQDYEKEFPLASSALRSNFYVDDCVVSAPTLADAQEIQRQLKEVLRRGGFWLTKWSSNHPSLCPLPDQDPASGEVSVESPITSALGLSWDSSTDQFKTHAPVDVSLGPVIIEGKIMLQDLHELKKGWDVLVPPEYRKRWKDFVLRLQTIKDVSIPRWISCFQSPDRVELHTFCDASTRAYGVAVYIVTGSGDESCARLLLAKSRVAPLSQLTIPKLELCGATLAAETIAKFTDAVGPDAIHFWTDSTIVLHWIHSPPQSYKVFVAHRVQRIRKHSSPDQWRHVVSEENPADIISRGVSPSQLMDNSLWFEGPEWIRCPERSWPPPFNPTACPEANCFLIKAKEFVFGVLLGMFSSILKVQRIVAYCLRFTYRGPRPLPKTNLAITADEMERALLFLIKMDQQSSLPEVCAQLEKGEALSREWKSLQSLALFLDRDGIIRVGGRLKNADEPFSTRHPVLLPRSLLTYRIVRHEHSKQLHAPPTLLLASVRQKFWPIAGRNLAKRVVHDCLKCYLKKPKPLDQLMGDLPDHRVNLYRPFQATGVDFAGPFNMISSATRGARSRKSGTQKVYIAIFVCMATKAAHLELVSSLSTEAFLAAFRRFAARRSTPRRIYSDCGKNFEGAANELIRLFNQEAAQQEIVNRTQDDGITWNFNPPASPHHGGLWEACVKSTKYHLVRATTSSALSYEEFHTILCQIESVLNSRPLCLLSDDPNERDYLTPGHFLVGAPGNAPPDPDLSHIPENRLSYWQHCQRRMQEFGRKWRLHYLNTLQQRPRWKIARENLKVDEVILLLDETKEGSKWVLGRVETIHPGTDGRVRVVSVRTSRGMYKRPITKIARLPQSTEESSGPHQEAHVQTGEDVGVLV
ncbi:uncharacterized protein LOC129808506 [Phlebotomus papatasi]|uniref:uncharacterized protein LOC129808506 n=1 Tax=Phlebotomus papatasi TaxID=29031 RepID=UPI0024834AF4|nr:uncharacterized protein LOC129808506 [Phlebotomus papatasi]